MGGHEQENVAVSSGCLLPRCLSLPPNTNTLPALFLAALSFSLTHPSQSPPLLPLRASRSLATSPRHAHAPPLAATTGSPRPPAARLHGRRRRVPPPPGRGGAPPRRGGRAGGRHAAGVPGGAAGATGRAAGAAQPVGHHARPVRRRRHRHVAVVRRDVPPADGAGAGPPPRVPRPPGRGAGYVTARRAPWPPRAQHRQQQPHGRVSRRVHAPGAQDAVHVAEQARRRHPRHRVRAHEGPPQALPLRQRVHRPDPDLHHVAEAARPAAIQEPVRGSPAGLPAEGAASRRLLRQQPLRPHPGGAPALRRQSIPRKQRSLRPAGRRPVPRRANPGLIFAAAAAATVVVVGTQLEDPHDHRPCGGRRRRTPGSRGRVHGDARPTPRGPCRHPGRRQRRRRQDEGHNARSGRHGRTRRRRWRASARDGGGRAGEARRAARRPRAAGVHQGGEGEVRAGGPAPGVGGGARERQLRRVVQGDADGRSVNGGEAVQGDERRREAGFQRAHAAAWPPRPPKPPPRRRLPLQEGREAVRHRVHGQWQLGSLPPWRVEHGGAGLAAAAQDHQGRGARAGAPVRRAPDAHRAARTPQVVERPPRRRVRAHPQRLRPRPRHHAAPRRAGDGGVQVAGVRGDGEAEQEERRVEPGDLDTGGAHRQVPGELPSAGAEGDGPGRVGALSGAGGVDRRGVRPGDARNARRRGRDGEAAQGRPRLLRERRGQAMGPQGGPRPHRRAPGPRPRCRRRRQQRRVVLR